MREWLIVLSEHAILLIDAIALVAIVFGTLQAALATVRGVFLPLPGRIGREVWMHYARWLVAGLTFLLAADIIETSITTDWEAIARVAAVALIRTFLNYFLERDLADVREQLTELPTADEHTGR